MLGIIDRFEGNFAVVELEDGRMVNLSRRDIPVLVKEGDVLDIGDKISINHEQTRKRKQKIERITKDLWE